MAYLSIEELNRMGFKSLGSNVKISDKASIYNCSEIEIGDNSRVDDFCILSGRIKIGNFCHITPMCLIAGGKPGIFINDFSTLAYGVKVFSQSDDYSGDSMTNSLIPSKYKNEFYSEVNIEKHVIIGTNSVIFPGVTLSEGTSIGAMSLVLKSTEAWGIYIGTPAKFLKKRSQKLLTLTEEFMRETK
ncbi:MULTISPECIES: acyltransferase [unclassified Acinetobacter]|jgi:acetyltransferase-like isoleucine patch superfamily enzyme|uniref:acyltransferase n=1 Tax=unclassified Acinetobacter TaxID=196816 RepID=UPI00140943FF|nr:acyltransferase [Acinetobacter sp. SA01]